MLNPELQCFHSTLHILRGRKLDLFSSSLKSHLYLIFFKCPSFFFFACSVRHTLTQNILSNWNEHGQKTLVYVTKPSQRG